MGNPKAPKRRRTGPGSEYEPIFDTPDWRPDPPPVQTAQEPPRQPQTPDGGGTADDPAEPDPEPPAPKYDDPTGIAAVWAPRDGVHAVHRGRGKYGITVDGVVVDWVKGRPQADARVRELQQAGG